MAILTPASSWDDIYQIATGDSVLGGAPTTPTNTPHQELVNRTEYLKELQKNSIRYLKNNYPLTTTGANPAKHLFTIDSVGVNITNIKFAVFMKQSSTTKAYIECRCNADIITGVSITGANALTLKSDSFSYCGEWSDEINIIAIFNNSLTTPKIDIWLECENSGIVDCVILPIFDETVSLSGWNIENGLGEITFVSDAINASKMSTSCDASTLGFESYDASSSYPNKQLDLASNIVAGSLPSANINNIKNTYIETVPDYLPVGTVIMWEGTDEELALLMPKWNKCDGTNGTTDMRGLFPRCASAEGDISGTGGNDNQTGTVTTTYNGSHNHTGEAIPYVGGYQIIAHLDAGAPFAPLGHTHELDIANSSSHNHTGTTASFDNRPAFVSLMFIKKIIA